MKYRKKKSFMVKPHPFTFYTYLSRFLYLLIIPLLQRLLIQPESIWEQIGITVMNTLFILFIVWFAVLKYRSIYYHQNPAMLSFRNGLFTKRSFRIPAEHVSAVYLHANPLYRMFGAVKVYITTNALADRRNITFITSRVQGHKIMSKLTNARQKQTIYKGSFYKIVFMALTWSNVVTGLLILAPFINRIGTVLGEEYSDKIYEQMDLTEYFVRFGLPPALASIAGLLIASYIISVIIQVMRFGRFKVISQGSKIIIPKGIGIKSRFMTDIEKINAVSVKQSILMIIFRIYTLTIHTLSSSRLKGDNNLLIPVTNIKGVKDILQNIDSVNETYSHTVKPQKKRAKNFLFLPVFSFISVILLAVFMYSSPILDDFVDLFLLFFVSLTLIWICFRFIAYRKTCVSLGEKTICIKSYSKLTILRTIIPIEDTESVVLQRSIPQRLTGTCHLTFTIRSSVKRKFTARHLDIKEAKALLKHMA